MKTLNLHRIWEILNKVTKRQDELHEKNSYVYLLNSTSYYIESDFENFLNYFSFKIDKECVEIFNYDGIPYENYNNEDIFYVPQKLLQMNDKELNVWIEDKICIELNRIELDKIAEKERLKQQIERLNKQLNDL